VKQTQHYRPDYQPPVQEAPRKANEPWCKIFYVFFKK
jgi:hypothetical protein